ncbi:MULTISPECIES: hypothetical protein [Anaeromyxobacter]|uniref:hypothetical protein n=1 Tax=Anaeromyxobacter TaxID=161492 RepID=UPI001F5A6A10|nr:MULTISPECIES: hypothetical protein [unclassified Anaeromyxobacter]
MKLLSKLLVAFVVLSGTAYAQSAKVDMGMGVLKALPKAAAAGAGEWQTLMTGSIHTSSQKDLMFGVSLVTSLFTDTTVASSQYRKSEAEAEAKIEVRVLVDGNEAAPNEVTFDRRRQYLMAQFDGFSCQILADGTVALDGCAYQDEILQLVLDTEAAHAFFFGAANVDVGYHTITVQARTTTSTTGLANAQALIGKAAFTVEEVRLVNGATIELK